MKTTFSRILTAVSIMLLAALLLVGIGFQLLVRSFLTRQAMEGLRADGEILVDLIEASMADETVSYRDFYVALTVSSSVSGADAVVCDKDGTLLFCARSPLGCQHQGMVIGQEYLERVYTDGISYATGVVAGLYQDSRFVVALPVMAEDGTTPVGLVMVSAPTENTFGILRRISSIFVWVSVLVVLATGILMTLYVRQQSIPLKNMAKAAQAFGHGDLTSRVEVSQRYTQEVQELALAFNNMASSLEKSEYQRTEFVANVSHELKTPMTTIAGYVDGILDGAIPKDKQEQYLRIVSDETKRLNRLVRSMLDISRLQDLGGVPEEQKSRFDLEECIGRVLITFEQKILDKKLEVQVDMPEHPVFTRANGDFITQVVYNLVDNGVKFSPEGGVLALTVREGGGKAYVSVGNQGQTIPPEELPLVFDRFHKTDKSRSQNRDSWGLGLYIVKTIVCSHGEDISVTSKDGQTTFTFTLPRVN